MKNKRIELLAPAGSFDKLKTAFLYGADACYIGGIDYSLRANATNFSIEEIASATEYAHKLGKKIYVTVNIVFHDEDFKGLIDYLKELSNIGVDAIISSDVSIIDIVKDNNIDLNIHISTQLSTSNIEAVKFFKNLGVERVVLARECSKEEIEEIIKETGIEIECFLHGAMCSSYSGRCVLSNYFTNRDANRGGCAQICRWCFKLNDGITDIENDTSFTMSTKDLSLISNLKSMIEIGITSLKVEGRMRSDYYIATVISTYRNAIDDYYKNNLTKEKIEYYTKVLNRVANRDSTSQFYDKFPEAFEQYFLGRKEVSNQDFLGVVLNYNKDTKEVTITQRNYFEKGWKVEIFGPNVEPFNFKVPDIYDEENNLLDAARHPTQIIKFKLDKEVYENDIMRIKIN